MDGRLAWYCAIAAFATAPSSEVFVEVKAEAQLLRNAHSDVFQVAIWRPNFDFMTPLGLETLGDKGQTLIDVMV
jgi:hypothetical protein